MTEEQMIEIVVSATHFHACHCVSCRSFLGDMRSCSAEQRVQHVCSIAACVAHTDTVFPGLRAGFITFADVMLVVQKYVIRVCFPSGM